MSISSFKPFITRRDMDSMLTCLVSEKIENGNTGRVFASELGRYLGTEEGFLLKEYYRALEIIFSSLELEKDSVVIVSPLAPFYYKKAIDKHGYKIEFADIDPDTACISPVSILEIMNKMGECVKAVVADSPLGFVPEIEKISETGLIVIEDISTLLGGEASGRKCGSFGSYTVLNLGIDKIITAAGGTYISCRTRKERENLKKSVEELSPDILLPDVNSALGYSQLGSLEKNINLRKEIAELYGQALMKSRYKTLTQKNEYKNINYSFPVLIDGSSIRELKKYASKKKIEICRGFTDSIMDRSGTKGSRCPEAEKLIMKCILFPLYPNMGKKNAETVLKVLNTLP